MNPTFVLDCSVTMAWCFADEASENTRRLQERLLNEAALVPPHWCLEVVNVLAMAERRNRISLADARSFLGTLTALQIQTEFETVSRVFGHALQICSAHRLTSYDAMYLDLAMQRNLPLATLDADLRRVAEELGVVLL